ncbi:glycine cleavage system aminomethyltransferase GcvT [Photobacterium damselae subsp. damselae]|uniref:glycine cleavage system aminomethyltransferase GcvT n=1 Tax=Photobacterium damselae TaxID=38293 RepID=UPI00311AEFD4
MTESLLMTPLNNMHKEAGAKMVPFAGYEMPVQYPLGVKKEHLHCREKAGLFDVSHMGQIRLIGEEAAKELEKLVPVDIIDLPVGKQRYALFTNEQGGIEDDLMVTNFGDCLYLVVNAACKHQDIERLKQHLAPSVTLEVLEDRALLALQGPKAAAVLAQLNPAVSDMVFMDACRLDLLGVECFVSRSGYTGEDGFEISVPNNKVEEIARHLVEFEEVEWIGLGARDSLRLECGLCLYSHDLTSSTTPVEASLLWAISPIRRLGGERVGGFPGADVILEQIKTKQIAQKRIGLIGLTKAPVREGAELLDENDQVIGTVTSGTYGPSIAQPVLMAFVDIAHTDIGMEMWALVRGKKIPVQVTKMPFVAQNYYRG